MQLEGTSLLIRADANARIGTGHLMRCLALAQGWKARGGQTVFITACESDDLRQRLSDEGFQVIAAEKPYPDSADWEITSQVLAAHPDAWVVLDGYHFDSAYQRQVKGDGQRLLVIDDMAHLDHYYADVILNQNINAEQLHYSCEPYTRLLLGTRYVLLRSEFLAWRGWQREIPKVARKVLVTLGGGDPDNQTLKVVRALQQVDVDGLEAVVVVGASNPHLQELQSVAGNSPFAIRLVQNVTNMPELMAWADVAISAAGTTCWELAFMGLPALLVVTAENQIDVARGVEQAGAVLNLGQFANVDRARISANLEALLSDVERRRTMSARGRELIDGHGAERVYAALVTGGLYLRPVSRADCRLLWSWANDPAARRMALNTAPIPFEDHIRWFEKKLASDNAVILILEHDAVPVGQIRFDLDQSGDAEIDVYVAPAYRGQYLGTYLLREGTRRYIELNKDRVRTVIGHVRPENVPSCRAFGRAGFRRMGTDIMQHVLLVRFVWAEGEA